MDTSKVIKVRVWDNDKNDFHIEELTIEEIIRDPFRKHINDIGEAVINELRKDRGLDPMPELHR